MEKERVAVHWRSRGGAAEASKEALGLLVAAMFACRWQLSCTCSDGLPQPGLWAPTASAEHWEELGAKSLSSALSSKPWGSLLALLCEQCSLDCFMWEVPQCGASSWGGLQAVCGLLAVPVALAGSWGWMLVLVASGPAYGCSGTAVVSHHCCPLTQTRCSRRLLPAYLYARAAVWVVRLSLGSGSDSAFISSGCAPHCLPSYLLAILCWSMEDLCAGNKLVRRLQRLLPAPSSRPLPSSQLVPRARHQLPSASTAVVLRGISVLISKQESNHNPPPRNQTLNPQPSWAASGSLMVSVRYSSAFPLSFITSTILWTLLWNVSWGLPSFQCSVSCCCLWVLLCRLGNRNGRKKPTKNNENTRVL